MAHFIKPVLDPGGPLVAVGPGQRGGVPRRAGVLANDLPCGVRHYEPRGIDLGAAFHDPMLDDRLAPERELESTSASEVRKA